MNLRVRDLLEFLDAPVAAAWNLTPDQAIDFLKSKGLTASFDYRDLIGAEHARAFTIAKMMDTDLLADVKASLDDAFAKGIPFKQWSENIVPALQAKGWWGKQMVTDPLTGETISAGLGSPHRLQTIYRTNMQSAYAAGAWDGIEANKDTAPYLLYDAVDDYRTRTEHAAWDGTVLEVDDPWWLTHYPPNGWNCRCSVIQVDEEELAELGLTPSPKAPDDGSYKWTNSRTGKSESIPKGLDPGWNQNAGLQRQALLQKQVADKLAALAPELKAAAAKGAKLAEAAGKAAAAADAKALARVTAKAAAGALKAQERIAGTAIADAIKAKTPFLAKAIQNLQATKAGKAMSASDLLAAAKVQAGKTETNVGLYEWKKSFMAGKAPPAKAQAVFDSLPVEKQMDLMAEMDNAKALAADLAAEQAAALAAEAAAIAEAQAAIAAAAEIAAQNAAAAELATLSTGTLVQKAAHKTAVAAIQGGATATEALAAALAEVETVKAAQGLAGVKSALKKALVNGKIPSPAQAKYLADLDDAAKAKFLAEVDKAKGAKPVTGGDEWEALPEDVDPVTGLDAQQQADEAAFLKMMDAEAAPTAPTPVTPAAQINPDNMVQIGPQKGSNPGGLYQDTTTGEKWYIKTPPSAEQARNEVLTGQLYRLAGIDTPELRLTTLNGQPAIASRIVDGLTKTNAAGLAKAEGALEGFVADAWLANWDVVGMTYDNLLLLGKRAFRVDTGAGLRFRAQGGAKGAAWGDKVLELDTLRDKGMNPQSAAVFGKATKSQLEAGARKLLALDRAEIDRLVDSFGPADLTERQALKATLRARLDDIARQLNITAKAPEAPAPMLLGKGQRIAPAEMARVTESRVNGYTISTDGDQIEDHQVLLMHYTDSKGTKRTRLVAKLRGDGADAALTKVAPLAKASPTSKLPGSDDLDLGNVRQAMLAMAKSINSRATAGKPWDSTIDTRIADFRSAAEMGKLQLRATAYQNPQGKAALAFIADIEKAVDEWTAKNQPGRKLTIIKHISQDALPNVPRNVVAAAKAAAKPAEVEWFKTDRFAYNNGQVDKANLREGVSTTNIPGVHEIYEGRYTDNSRVRFVANTSGNTITSRGLVHIEVDGQDINAAEAALTKLQQLGVVTTRTTQGERLGLYLDKIANVRGFKKSRGAAGTKLRDAYAKLATVKDEAARNAAKLKLLNQDVGYDITKSPHWNPDGVYQAFGHGRTLQMRPDLDGPEMAAFEKSKLVYTNVTGLGTGASDDQWNRLLRAIDGGGTLSSQMERARRGIESSGSSVGSDHESGGANYIFTRLKSSMSKAAGVYFKPRIMRRIDAVTYDGDKFGNISDAVQQRERHTLPETWKDAASNGGNETIFRDGLSLFDDLEKILFRSAAERTRAIADMRARGYMTWPDGRKLEDVLQVAK